MDANKGGRGLRAKYPTKVMRVPELLEPEVTKMVNSLYSGTLLPDNAEQLEIEVSNLPSKNDMILLADKLIRDKKSARISLTKLLQVIYCDESIKL